MNQSNKLETSNFTDIACDEHHHIANDNISGTDMDNTFPIIKFYPRANQLKSLIKYFWIFKDNSPVNLYHKLLPVNNIDLIFNFKSPITFEQNGMSYEAPSIGFFRGLTKEYTLMKQQGTVLTIGVSFFPAGFYPFFRIPVSEFRNKVVGFPAILKNGANEIETRLKETETISEKIRLLEDFFLALLFQNTPLNLNTYKLLRLFYSSNLSLNEFYAENGVHPRKFERVFGKYIGTTPKLFSRLSRFQIILNLLIFGQQKSLTTLAYEFGYYDQSHFIKDFKSFTGSSPLGFLKENRSLKQIIR